MGHCAHVAVQSTRKGAGSRLDRLISFAVFRIDGTILKGVSRPDLNLRYPCVVTLQNIE